MPSEYSSVVRTPPGRRVPRSPQERQAQRQDQQADGSNPSRKRGKTKTQQFTLWVCRILGQCRNKPLNSCVHFSVVAVDKIKKPSEERDELGNSFTDGDGKCRIFMSIKSGVRVICQMNNQLENCGRTDCMWTKELVTFQWKVIFLVLWIFLDVFKYAQK